MIETLPDSTELARRELRRRFGCLPAAGIKADVYVERGGYRDYERLSCFHYRGASPGATTAVFRLVHDRRTVVGRFLSRPAERIIVGALVRSLPHLLCRLRNLATGGRYRDLGIQATAVVLNREFRTISRVVIDPRWRGLGLASRLVRHALAHPETMFTEAFAAMAHVHPFFERAGMTRYDQPVRAGNARLLDALRHIGVPSVDLGSPDAVLRRVEQGGVQAQCFLEAELRHWWRCSCRTSNRRLDQMTLREMLVGSREKLLTRPVYYLFDHRCTDRGPHASDSTGTTDPAP